MKLSKEADYIFEYDFEGELLTEKVNHFVDDIENRRYIWNQETGYTTYPIPLNFKGTSEDFKEIKPMIIGEKQVEKNEREEVRMLVFDLIDIPYVLICQVSRRSVHDNEFYDFIINGVEQYFEKIG